MAWIPPVEQRIDEITFCTFNSDYEFASIDNHYVNIVVERDDVGRVYLDGALIGADEFHPVNGSSDYSFVRKHINHGTHHLACATGLIAHVYGFGDARGYAYCVGANVVSLTQKLLVNGVWSEFYHDGLYMCKDEIADMTVQLAEQDGRQLRPQGVGLESQVRPRQDDGRHDRDLEEEAAVITRQFV